MVGNISPIWGEAPTVPIETKICMAGKLADIMTCAKFQDDIFRGYNFTRGRISHFPIDFCMGLTTMQRQCAACDWDKKLAHLAHHIELTWNNTDRNAFRYQQ